MKGVNCTIRDGIAIGKGCVIGAGALIMHDTEPLLFIKAIKPYEEVAKMAVTIIIVTIAFIWLLLETKFLTIHLLQLAALPPPELNIGELLMLGIAMVFLAVGFTMFEPEENNIPRYERYYILWKDPVLHRVLKLYHKDRLIPPGLLEMAEIRTRTYERIESEIETVIEQ